jgi:DNA-binding MarR family transcriptional regulator
MAKHETPRRPSEPAGRYSYEGLERVIHEKARLGILTSLMSHPIGLAFADLKDLCGLTDGNLNRHLHALEEAALIETWKTTQRNRPQTLCRLTDEGRSRFMAYIASLEQVVADAAASAKAQSGRQRGVHKGFSPA